MSKPEGFDVAQWHDIRVAVQQALDLLVEGKDELLEEAKLALEEAYVVLQPWTLSPLDHKPFLSLSVRSSDPAARDTTVATQHLQALLESLDDVSGTPDEVGQSLINGLAFMLVDAYSVI